MVQLANRMDLTHTDANGASGSKKKKKKKKVQKRRHWQPLVGLKGGKGQTGNQAVSCQIPWHSRSGHSVRAGPGRSSQMNVQHQS